MVERERLSPPQQQKWQLLRRGAMTLQWNMLGADKSKRKSRRHAWCGFAANSVRHFR